MHFAAAQFCPWLAEYALRSQMKFFRKQRNGQKKTNRRSTADRVLAQGVGKTVRRAFGARRGVGLSGWDAFSPCHLPLPRSVGPYTVVRTTSLINSNDRVNIVGCMGSSDTWVNIGLLRSVNSSLPINDPNNTIVESIPFPGVPVGGSGLTAVPAAISVQIMNSNPLQTTEGIIAGAVSTAQLDLRDRTETWAEFGSEFISYMRPRLMSAGKLTLRGVQADSYPLNMNALSAFLPVTNQAGGPITLTDASWPYGFQGFAPIVLINQGSSLETPLTLQYLVTIEWRVRFDIGNPAVSSHMHHGVTSDSTWDRLVSAAASRGHGMLDIVEHVANTGTAVANAAGAAVKAYRAIAPATRMLPMLAP